MTILANYTEPAMISFLDNLENRLQEIKIITEKYLNKSTFYYHDPNTASSNFIFLGAPVNHWGPATDEQILLQTELKKKYNELFERFRLLFGILPTDKEQKLNISNNAITNYIERIGDAPGSTLQEASLNFSNQFLVFEEVLRIFKSEKKDIVLVPDTNALLVSSEPSDYLTLANNSKITLLYIPAVLSELDHLKIFHKLEDVRKKALSVVNRLKGYRKQGNVLAGTQINDGKITIKMHPIEPNFNKSFSWFDPNNSDDRILATIIQLQIERLNSVYILVTRDINLQNKAIHADIPFLDADAFLEKMN